MSKILEPAADEGEGHSDVITDPIEPAAGTESSAAPETDQPAANSDQPTANESVHDFLMRQLTAEEEEPQEAPEPAAKADEKDEPPADPVKEPAEEPPAEDPTTQEPSESDDPEKSDSTSNTAAIKIVSREEIEKQFPRAPKEVRDIAAANAEAAIALQKQIETDFGGEHMAEPMKMIAKGLIEDDNIPVIHGILGAQGVDGFTGLLADFLHVALIDAPKADQKDEANRYFAEACSGVAEKIFKECFGENATPVLIKKLLKYEADGLLNTGDVDSFYTEDGEGKPNPIVKEQEDKIADLERQLAESKATETDKKATAEVRFAEEWSNEIFTETTTSLDDLYLKHSVLKPVKGDSPELTAGKDAIRKIVLESAREAQKADPEFKKLQAAAYRGNGETGKYKKAKAALVENTVFHAKKIAAPLEALVSQIYALGRNANLPVPLPAAAKAASAGDPQPTNPQLEPKEPTQTTTAEKKPMTLEEWNKHMREEIRKMDA